MADKQHPPISASLQDVWRIVRVVEGTYGFNLGLMQFVFYVFLYDHFGGNAFALQKTVFIFFLTNVGFFLFEVPTGALGDYIGRKKTVIFCFFTAAIAYFFRSWIYFAPSPDFAFVLSPPLHSLPVLQLT